MHSLKKEVSRKKPTNKEEDIDLEISSEHECEIKSVLNPSIQDFHVLNRTCKCAEESNSHDEVSHAYKPNCIESF